jgi:Adenosine deaminase
MESIRNRVRENLPSVLLALLSIVQAIALESISFSVIAFFCLYVPTSSAQSVHMSDSADDVQEFLAGMPKAELHLHLEGTLSPETIVEITNRNGIDYFTTVDEVEQPLANRPPGLMGFLEHHYKSQNVM